MVPDDCDPVTATAFEREILAAVAAKPGLLRLNCRSLERVVSSHISLLWNSRDLCDRSGVTMELVSPSGPLVQVLEILDLADAFRFADGKPLLPRRPDPVPVVLPRPYSLAIVTQVRSDCIDDAIGRVVSLLERLRVSPDVTLELRTLLYEVATNIRTHSGLTPDDSFSIDVTADQDGLTATFTDAGLPFDPTTRPGQLNAATASRHWQKRGFGLPMIHRLAGTIAYRRIDESRNELVVTKKWRR